MIAQLLTGEIFSDNIGMVVFWLSEPFHLLPRHRWLVVMFQWPPWHWLLGRNLGHGVDEANGNDDKYMAGY